MECADRLSVRQGVQQGICEISVRTDATQRMRMFSRNLEHQYSLTGNAGLFGFRDDVSRSRRRSDRGAHSSAARVPPFGQLLRPPVSDTSQDQSSGFALFASTLQGCLVSSAEPFGLLSGPGEGGYGGSRI
jgi:hypothetical protein